MRSEHASDRAQTAQDFAVGIGIFLLTIAFVFAFLPTVLSPFDTDVGAAEQAQADRVVTLIAHNITEDGRTNHVNETSAEEFFDAGNDIDTIQNETGTPFDARVNVTMTPLDEDEPVDINGETATAGPTYRSGTPAVSASRVLVVEDDGGECDPACQLEVRVW